MPQGNQLMSVAADNSLLTRQIMSQFGEGEHQFQSQVLYCENAQQAIDALSTHKADFVLVLSEDETPIVNVFEYIKNFKFEDACLPIVLYFKVQD